MRPIKLITVALIASLSLVQQAFAQCPGFLDNDIRLLHSDRKINLCDRFNGQPLLIVNTASHCGYTYQFKQLEQLHQRYNALGLAVIGFPSNDFRQEAGDETAIAQVCHQNYGVSFTMSAPVNVTGEKAHPLFQFLNGKAGSPQWNFNKYLVSADGQLVIRLPSQTEPDSAVMEQSIRKVM